MRFIRNRITENKVFCIVYLLLCHCISHSSATISLSFPNEMPNYALEGDFHQFQVNDSVIKFPKNGKQPTTSEAAEWSCARIDAHNIDSPITKWYVNAFCPYRVGLVSEPAGVLLFGENETGRSTFANVFRPIAANPVGRVLLYRIFIEIHRQNEKGQGCCEDRITRDKSLKELRENCRQLKAERDDDFNFSSSSGTIRFGSTEVEVQAPSVRITKSNIPEDVLCLDTKVMSCSADIALYHELLHWFHCLRNPERYVLERTNSPCYQYLSRCYYGDISEFFTWSDHFMHEEMRTILGAPNYGVEGERDLFKDGALLRHNPPEGGITILERGFLPKRCEFYNGDDLSENAYRMAKHTADHPVRMRFGHTVSINRIIASPNAPRHFRLAHLVAQNCCAAIGLQINSWELKSGEAAAP